MTELKLDGQKLILRAAGGEIALDLAHALRPRMYTRPETRPYTPTSPFAVHGVYPFAGGLRVVLVNQAEGLLIPVVIKPEADGFRFAVETGRIVEQYGLNRKLMELDVLPEFMTSRVGDDGWFLLPSFAGVLTRFRERPPTVNRDRIYMAQAEWEKMNLFNAYAMKRNGNGVLAIVHQGDFFCHVTTELNQKGCNRIYASFGLRHHPAEPIKQEDKEVVFRFVHGADAEYPGMAKVFRRYLIEERGVAPLKPRLADNPVLKYSVSAMRTKIFHAVKAPFVADGRSPVQSCTTFEEAGRILDAMRTAGIGKAVVTLVGWNLGGHDGAYPTRFPIEPVLGGEEGLKALIAKAKAMGYQIVPHDNWTDHYRVAPDFDADTIARDEHGLMRVYGHWGGGQALKSCPLTVIERYGHDFDRVRKLGFDGHYYMDAQSSVLWTCHDPRHPADEKTFMTALAGLTQIPRAHYGAIACEVGPVHHLPFVEEIGGALMAPAATYCLPRCSEAFRNLFDEIVPFYLIAIHGLVTYQMGWVHGFRHWPGGVKQGLLYELAHGGRPSMEIKWRPGGFGDGYTDSIRDVRDAYRIAFEELPDIHAETIEGFEMLAPEANRVAYANGCTVSVNWGKTAVGDLAPMSYRIERV